MNWSLSVRQANKRIQAGAGVQVKVQIGLRALVRDSTRSLPGRLAVCVNSISGLLPRSPLRLTHAQHHAKLSRLFVEAVVQLYVGLGGFMRSISRQASKQGAPRGGEQSPVPSLALSL